MSNPAEPGRTGRGARTRAPLEAPPSDKLPEDEAPVAEGEAEPSVTEGIYFSKVPSREVYHAFDDDNDPVGSCYKSGDRWYVKFGRDALPGSHGSAAVARGFLAGYALGHEAGYADGEGFSQETQTKRMLAARAPGGSNAKGTVDDMPGTAVERSTDATHDADAGLS